MAKTLEQRIRTLSALWVDDPHEDVRNEDEREVLALHFDPTRKRVFLRSVA